MRHDKVDRDGGVTLRYLSRLRRIYVGREHRGERIRLFVAGAQVRIVLEQNGALLRELTVDPDHRYFGIARPVHNDVRQVSSMS